MLMARFCDEQAEVCGEQQQQADGAGGGLGKELVDTVAGAAGDCCIPKSQRKEIPK